MTDKLLCSVKDCQKPMKCGDKKYCCMHRARLYRTGRLYKKPFKEKIEENIQRIPESGCWIWMGYLNKWGYGRLRRNGNKILAHRAAYEEYKQLIPNGLLACHTCDTPSCVNPDHIFIGTHADNMRDAANKGRKRRNTRQRGITNA